MDILEQLTFGDLMELMEKIEKERPNPEKTEIAALAYKYGYEAGLKAQSEK